MQDIQQQIRQLIERPDEPVSKADVELWMSLCPYFALPVLRYLQQHGDSLDTSRRRRLQLLVAMHSSDPARARDILCGDDDEAFYPEPQRPRKPTTESTIDTFLDKYGNCDAAEEELLTRLIFNPTPDYAQQLAAQEAESLPDEPVDPDDNSQDALINRFIITHQHGEHAQREDDVRHSEPTSASKPEPAPAPAPKLDVNVAGGAAPGHSALSLSLARIYLKQHRYGRAKEIITQLSLNNPEKSVYFADQLRFIDKLIRNQELKSSQNQ